MSLKDQISADYMTAFRAKDTEKKNFLGVIKGEIQLAESKDNFKGEESVLAIVRKMEKSLNENAENGDDTARNELEYLKPYLPQLMNEGEIRTILEKYVADGATPNIGFLMGSFNRDHSGKADNKVVSRIAKEILA